jgi:hypothetical protein
MTTTGLIIGVLLMVLSGIAAIVFLALPSLTSNHVSRSESMMGLIPAVIVFSLAFLLTAVSGIFLLKSKKAVR